MIGDDFEIRYVVCECIKINVKFFLKFLGNYKYKCCIIMNYDFFFLVYNNNVYLYL